MNHELAKALAKCGLDIKRPRDGKLIDKFGHTPIPFPMTQKMAEDLDYVYLPTLDEIIIALGDDFGYLEYRVEMFMPSVYIAYSSNMENDLRVKAHIVEMGETPILAMARLYIALNNK